MNFNTSNRKHLAALGYIVCRNTMLCIEKQRNYASGADFLSCIFARCNEKFDLKNGLLLLGQSPVLSL